MFNLSNIGGAQARPSQAIDHSPFRACPSSVDLPRFLMTIGNENRLPEVPSPPSSPLPVLVHPTVEFSLDEEGDIDMRGRMPIPGVQATEEDEMLVYSSWLKNCDDVERIVNSGMHDKNGWILWKYNADPKKPKHENVLFTMGGPLTGKNNESIDESTKMKICCDSIHADLASGGVGHWMSAKEYDYIVEEDSDVESSDAEGSDAEGGGSDLEGAVGGDARAIHGRQRTSQTASDIMEKYPEIKRASQLGDIEVTCEILNGHPVWKAKNGSVSHDILFSTGSFGEPVGMSYPPYIAHQVGQIHSDMASAYWGWWCYENPEMNNHREYENLCRGLQVRYAERP